ncbi:hypothetical protein MUTS15_40860 [Escherichia coli]|nr:hypothetical protein MUTS15_40860 [Escherichia coli]
MSDYVNTGVEAWKPNFYISADNKNITDKIRKGLINITLTDYGGSSKQTDELRVAIVSETLKIPARGVKISIGLGFGNQIIDKGIYIVDGASSGGEPRVVDFTAKAAPMNAAKDLRQFRAKDSFLERRHCQRYRCDNSER